jgi:hypothetical protein
MELAVICVFCMFLGVRIQITSIQFQKNKKLPVEKLYIDERE